MNCPTEIEDSQDRISSARSAWQILPQIVAVNTPQEYDASTLDVLAYGLLVT
jgi:hypothetical protein